MYSDVCAQLQFLCPRVITQTARCRKSHLKYPLSVIGTSYNILTRGLKRPNGFADSPIFSMQHILWSFSTLLVNFLFPGVQFFFCNATYKDVNQFGPIYSTPFPATFSFLLSIDEKMDFGVVHSSSMPQRPAVRACFLLSKKQPLLSS